MRIVIVGGGAATASAIESIRATDGESDVVVISQQKTICSLSLLPYYLAGDIPEERLLFRDANFYSDRKVTALCQRATKVIPERNAVILTQGEEIGYDQLLIATGSSPSRLEAKGTDMRGIFSFNTAADAQNVIAWCEKATTAVVVGASFIGVEVAIALCKRGIRVYLVERQDRVLPTMLDCETAELAKQRLKANGIEVLLSDQAREFLGNGTVTEAVLDSRRVTCDMAIVTIGVFPNLSPVAGSGIATGTGILVDDYMRTNIDNVYAAGDVAEARDIVSGNRSINAIWPNAIKQGKIAGYNMTGRPRRYEGSDKMNVIDIFGMPFVSLGHRTSDCEEIKVGGNSFSVRSNRITGLTAAGDVRNAGVILSLIRDGSDISWLRDNLQRQEHGYAHTRYAKPYFIRYT